MTQTPDTPPMEIICGNAGELGTLCRFLVGHPARCSWDTAAASPEGSPVPPDEYSCLSTIVKEALDREFDAMDVRLHDAARSTEERS
jgi:hypothetical protein